MKFLNVYIRSLNFLWDGERALTLSLVLASVLVGVVQVAEPLLFGRVIDTLVKKGNVLSVLVVWVVLGVVSILSSVFLAVMSDRLAHRQRLQTLDQVFERVIALPVSYHSEQGSGRVVHAILTGTDQLFHLWLSFMREHLSSIIGILLLMPIAVSLNGKMAFLLFLLSLVYLVANFKIVKKTHLKQEQVTSHHQNLFARIGDVIGNVTVVQSYARLWEEIHALQRITSQLLSLQYPILTWWGILSVITRISSTLAVVALLVQGSLLVSKGELSVGEVVSFVSFSGLLIGRFEQISGFVSRTISQAPALEKFFGLLDQNGASQETPGAKAIYNVKGEVRFENVTYSYKNTNVGVFDLNFSVKPGQTAALVGLSGSGKTTTLALLQRLFDPLEGRILIDGEDVRNFTLASLRHGIATVFQDSGLFNRSIAENIRIGKPDATIAEVEQAARLAAAHEFIMQKPGGYEFIIGERGAALSGGERQRIAIARAILKNASILVLDEATSALDNQTEKTIQEAVMQLRIQEKTTFIIAHRLSTVMSADLILVFDKGKIAESGTFEELRKRDGLFASLVRIGELNAERRAKV